MYGMRAVETVGDEGQVHGEYNGSGKSAYSGGEKQQAKVEEFPPSPPMRADAMDATRPAEEADAAAAAVRAT